MIATVAKQMRFEATHHLPYVQGADATDHGHVFVLHLALTGPVQAVTSTNPESGMVTAPSRFGAFLTDLFDTVLNRKNLNESLEPCPTLEQLCVAIAELAKSELEPCMPEGVFVSCVRLYDDHPPTANYAEVSFPGVGLSQ